MLAGSEVASSLVAQIWPWGSQIVNKKSDGRFSRIL